METKFGEATIELSMIEREMSLDEFRLLINIIRRTIPEFTITEAYWDNWSDESHTVDVSDVE
jgi:hypothetical protein